MSDTITKTIYVTNDYGKFKFRDDNREQINKAQVKVLAEAIRESNKLHLYPMLVNQDYEIINGQHRLLAAKDLGVNIYYEIDHDFKDEDLLAANSSKQWVSTDYLNYWCKHHSPEYLKLHEFIKKTGLQVRVAIDLCRVRTNETRLDDFRKGKFLMREDVEVDVDVCHQTVMLIREYFHVSNTIWSSSVRFWKALILLVRHVNFEREHWIYNLKKYMSSIGIRASILEYLKLFGHIYNNGLRKEKRIEIEANDLKQSFQGQSE